MKIVNKNNLPTINVNDVVVTQGELKYLSKDNYRKLKNSIEKNGFYIPIFIWKDEENNKSYLLDGTQRRHVIKNEGWDDKEVPYISIPAKDLKDAAERLLVITGQMGTITQEGIDNFIATYELPEAEVFDLTHFDGIRFYELGDEKLEKADQEMSPGERMNQEDLRDSMSVSLTFDKASFVEFMTFANYFRELYGVDTVTDAIVQAVREKYEDAIR
jgi:hypothetical protein